MFCGKILSACRIPDGIASLQCAVRFGMLVPATETYEATRHPGMEHETMSDASYVQFLQTYLPRLGLRWQDSVKCVGRRSSASSDGSRNCNSKMWRVFDSMCRISISRFYRDKGVFETVQQDVLPQLAEMVRAEPEPVLRCWSAGCFA